MFRSSVHVCVLFVFKPQRLCQDLKDCLKLEDETDLLDKHESI